MSVMAGLGVVALFGATAIVICVDDMGVKITFTLVSAALGALLLALL